MIAAPSPPRAVHVVIVEDNQDLAEGLAVNLRREGYRVSLSHDGRHALVLLRAERPDAVVLDVGLPGVDGFTLLARLRAEGVDCPVLMLTARGEETDLLEGFRLGADDYVTKPFRTLELLARVRRLLQRPPQGATGAAAPEPVRVAPAPSAIGFSDAELAARYALTERQIVVLRLIVEGLSNNEIGATLGISPFTARNHVEQVLGKIGVATRGRAGAALHAAYVAARAEAGSA